MYWLERNADQVLITSFPYSHSTKAVYISGMVYYGIGMLILGLWPTKWGVLVFSTSAGILYGTLFTMPFILVANYHAKNCVCNNSLSISVSPSLTVSLSLRLICLAVPRS